MIPAALLDQAKASAVEAATTMVDYTTRLVELLEAGRYADAADGFRQLTLYASVLADHSTTMLLSTATVN